MSIRSHFIQRKAASLLSLAACVVSILMLLAFPIRSAHQFSDHFRTPEVRRSIERHTPIAHPDSRSAERTPHQALLPALLIPTDDLDALKPAAHFDFAEIPISRLLLRLKLGSSRSGSQDPLL
jgi:hypothetical protein